MVIGDMLDDIIQEFEAAFKRLEKVGVGPALAIVVGAVFFGLSKGIMASSDDFEPALLALEAVGLIIMLAGAAWSASGARRAAGGAEEPVIKSLFPLDCFTPYSVCPKCGVEALHWIGEPDRDTAFWLEKDFATRMRNFEIRLERWDTKYGPNGDSPILGEDGVWQKYPGSDAEGNGELHNGRLYRYKPPERPALTDNEVAFIEMAKHDVVRTCRECEHGWGQDVSVAKMLEAA
jgi:hypothetical protein